MTDHETQQTDAPLYGREVFVAAYKLCGGGRADTDPFVRSVVRIEDTGVYADEVGIDDLDWTQAVALDEPGSDDPAIAPLLPFPFSAAQFAAFLLDSWGWFMQGAFGEWDTGPDEAFLRGAGIRATKVKEAVREAYRAYREAEKVVGALDRELQSRAAFLSGQIVDLNDAANKTEGVMAADIDRAEYKARRARAKAVTEPLQEERDRVVAEARDAMETWRTSMVRYLVHPGRSRAASDAKRDRRASIERMLLQLADPAYQETLSSAEAIAARSEQAKADLESWKKTDDRNRPSERVIKRDNVLLASAEAKAADAAHRAARGDTVEGAVDVAVSASEQLANPSGEVVPATKSPAARKSMSWWAHAGDYARDKCKSGEYVSAKLLYKALVSEAGPSSPFERGSGGSLIVRRTGKTVDMKTFQNRWPDIRKESSE